MYTSTPGHLPRALLLFIVSGFYDMQSCFCFFGVEHSYRSGYSKACRSWGALGEKTLKGGKARCYVLVGGSILNSRRFGSYESGIPRIRGFLSCHVQDDGKNTKYIAPTLWCLAHVLCFPQLHLRERVMNGLLAMAKLWCPPPLPPLPPLTSSGAPLEVTSFGKAVKLRYGAREC